jgi:hypothetical protein
MKPSGPTATVPLTAHLPRRGRSVTCLLLLVLSLAGVPAPAGDGILLYPLSRLFGGPSESELVRCRAAFTRLQTEIGRSRVRVMPVLCADSSDQTARHRWRADLAGALARDIAAGGAAAVEPCPEIPGVNPPTPFRNQLRYLMSRSALYGAWVGKEHPPGDYFVVAEILGGRGKVGAIQIFVFDASGQVAYRRLLNSHQFGPDLPLAGGTAVQLIARTLLADLRKSATQVFPPYGVG